jgi:hypothetical protein
MLSKYTFLTGAPGSRWSGVAQLLTDNFNYNKSDESEERQYVHGEFTGHKGSYFGPGMKLGEDFHRLEQSYFNNLRFQAMCNSAFADSNLPQTKMIKCHQFAYGLDWLKKNVPNSNILLVKRPTEASFDWWKDAGGWNITYPNYQWYLDDAHMQHYIDTEIKLADMFVEKTKNSWSHITEEWLTENFGTHSIAVPNDKYHDTEVCLITTDF